MIRQLVLGTAGHIDHGKTALIRALTGVDTDRLPEEKRRGITIDLGFAHLSLPDGTSVAIVDVPGHEAFVRNMLAGATGIDIVLLVVAADEGPMPQTREHLHIVELLGIRRCVVALTKCDLTEPEWLELVRAEIRELIDATTLAGAPIIDVSARTGAGLPDLVRALAELADSAPDRDPRDLFRMPIDRVFTVRGTGTVVTGTVWSGSLDRDATVRILPAGITARVRALQQHGAEQTVIGAGSRAAVALAGMDRHATARGDLLVTDSAWAPAGVLTVLLSVVGDAGDAIRPRQRVRVHAGTAEVFGRVALPGGPVPPGGSALAQLRLETPLVCRAGDRVVLRSWSPPLTIGGAIVIEPRAPKRRRFPPADEAALGALSRVLVAGGDAMGPLLALHAERGIEAAHLAILAGATPEDARRLAEDPRAHRAAGRLLPADAVTAVAERITDALRTFHDTNPMLDGIERDALRASAGIGEHRAATFDAALATLVARGDVIPVGNAFALAGHNPGPDADGRRVMERIAGVYVEAGLEPPAPDELPPDLAARPDLPLLLRFLERDGTLLRLSANRWIAAEPVAECVRVLRTQLDGEQELGIAEFKDVLKLTRKHLIPLLEHLDRTGVTIRRGDARTLSPR